MTFGERLKKSRKEKKLTQEQVARLIGIDDTTISKYENDKSEPDNVTLNKLCDLYGVKSDYLYGREVKEVTTIEETEADAKRKQGLEYIKQIKDEKTLDLAIELLEKLARE